MCCVFLDAVPLSLMPRPRAPSQTIARPPSWTCLAVLWPRNGRPTLGRQGPPVQMTMRRRSTWSGTRRGPRWGLAGARPAPPPPPPPPARPRSPRCPRTPVAPPSSTVVSTHVLYTWLILLYICSLCELKISRFNNYLQVFPYIKLPYYIIIWTQHVTYVEH